MAWFKRDGIARSLSCGRGDAKMNLPRLAVIGFFCASALAAWVSQRNGPDTHWATRKLEIQSTLGRVENPIVVLGDSIVEAAKLPPFICGHPVVNAGIGGASTASGIDAAVAAPAGSTQPRLVLITLGANDAAKAFSADQFESQYRSLIMRLRPLASRIAVLGVSPVELGLREANKQMDQFISEYNGILPTLAQQTGADFIPMPSMPARHTSDGLHLNGSGYAVWDAAVRSGIERLVCQTNGVPQP